MIIKEKGGGVVISRQGNISWWLLQKEIEGVDKIKEDVHGKSQDKTCILPIAIDKEDEETAIEPNLEVSGDASQVGELETIHSQYMAEIAEKARQPLRRSLWLRKKNPKFANTTLVQDVGDILRSGAK